jgi:Flp pilus assembly protein TadD
MLTRSARLAGLAVLAGVALSACSDPEADRAAIKGLGDLNVIDESNLNDIMLNFADPNAAANYFRDAVAQNPDRDDLRRGYAQSLMRANRSEEAAIVYAKLAEDGKATPEDRLGYAEALIQSGKWPEGEAQLHQIPPTVDTYDRYRLEAMMADFRQQWQKSDAFYQSALGLTTRPAPVYNNWGISMMARGNQSGAEEKFLQAISADPGLFSAKNNLAINRAKRKNYTLPVVPMTSAERAQLLYNVALQALRNGDRATAKGMMEEAVEVSPQHFPEAVASLEALSPQVVN